MSEETYTHFPHSTLNTGNLDEFVRWAETQGWALGKAKPHETIKLRSREQETPVVLTFYGEDEECLYCRSEPGDQAMDLVLRWLRERKVKADAR